MLELWKYCIYLKLVLGFLWYENGFIRMVVLIYLLERELLKDDVFNVIVIKWFMFYVYIIFFLFCFYLKWIKYCFLD